MIRLAPRVLCLSADPIALDALLAEAQRMPDTPTAPAFAFAQGLSARAKVWSASCTRSAGPAVAVKVTHFS
jgi:hypothetical protein